MSERAFNLLAITLCFKGISFPVWQSENSQQFQKWKFMLWGRVVGRQGHASSTFLKILDASGIRNIFENPLKYSRFNPKLFNAIVPFYLCRLSLDNHAFLIPSRPRNTSNRKIRRLIRFPYCWNMAKNRGHNSINRQTVTFQWIHWIVKFENID